MEDIEGQETQAEPSLRDSLIAATEAVETPPADETPPSPADETPPAEPRSETKGAAQEEKQGLQRDGKGKFQKKEGEQPPPVEDATQLPKGRAPSSWRPALREKWTALPTEVQQEVLKREKEISQGFNEIGEVKKFRDTFMQTINPYSHIFQAEGGQPLKTINDLLQTANTLYSGAPMQKAQTVASMIKNFGIDIQMLDNLLSGQAPAQGGQQGGQSAMGGPDVSRLVQQAVQQALAPMLQGQQAQAQQQEQDAQSAIEEFAQDPANEFFDDVKDAMADIFEGAAKRGQKMDLSTAYQRAILTHSDIADIVAQRRFTEKSSAATAVAQAARRKAVSITGAPARVSAAPTDTIRGALENAIETLGA